MSEVSMIMGYAVKRFPVTDDEHVDELCDNFDYELHNKWQRFYDFDGCEYLVYLTDYECEFLDSITTSVNIAEMLEVSQSLHNYMEEEELRVDVDIHFFVKVWYNGTDMGSIIEDKQ